jgi:hypothetical protein
MPATEVGVFENFIMMEEIEIDKILIKSKMYGCDGLFDFTYNPPKCSIYFLCTE